MLLLAGATAAPVVEIVALNGPNLHLRMFGSSERWVLAERSRDLRTWVEIRREFSVANGVDLIEPVLPAAAGFYRAREYAPNAAYVTNYNGWTNAILVSNGQVEAIVVPDCGRVMQFRFVGETNGPFWENPSLAGRVATPSSWNTPGSFGGDKAWPSPQSVWNWPPPSGFDGSRYTAAISNGVAYLFSGEDTSYRMKVRRRIELDFSAPVLRIATTFERTAPTTRTNTLTGVWVVTQLKDPVKCYVPAAMPSIFARGYTLLGSSPLGLTNINGLISLQRSPSSSAKVGFDAGTMLWVGSNWCLRVDSPRPLGLPASAFPDSGSSTEIYTNPGSAAYVELETLGPMSLVALGGQIETTNVYTLTRRSLADSDAEARYLLGLP